MPILKFIPIKLTLCLILGILIGHFLQFEVYIPLISFILFIAILGIIFIKGSPRNSVRFGLVALTSCVLLGVLAVSLWLPKNQENHYSHQDSRKEHLWKIKIVEVLKSNTFSDRYIAKVVSRDGHEVSGKILLRAFQNTKSETFRIDDELYFFGKFSSIKPPLNPYQFNYRSYLSNLGIYHQILIDPTNHYKTNTASKTIYGLAASFRNRIVNKLKEAHFGHEELSIMQALILGQRNDISEELFANYKNAGALHILAVSGLHIGILLVLLQFILRPLNYLPKGKGLKLLLTVILLWCFALVTGFSASVVRAVTMFSFIAYALYLNRPSNTFNILALSMFAILLIINPMFLFQVGFQMSYAAVIAIVWIYPLLQRLWYPKNALVKKTWQLLSVGIAAQLGVLPISLFYFHQFPALFFVSNLLIVPALGVILGIGILTNILALINLLPDWLVLLYNHMIGLMNTIIEAVARQEIFVFENIPFDSVQLVLSYAAIISLLLLCSHVSFKRTIIVLGWVLCFQLWTFYSHYVASQKEALLIAHQNKNSILLHRSGHNLNVHTKDTTISRFILRDFMLAERIESTKYAAIENRYQWHDEKILVIDSFGLYAPGKADCIVLIQSPKISLDRLIDSIHPKRIVADGSNYLRYIARWKKTCAQRKLPFHYTGEKGAFYFD